MWFFFRFITWEQRKFSELANTRRGLTYNPTNIVENGVRVLRSSNIKEDVFTLSEDDVFVCANAVNIEYVHEHEILITAANGSTRLVGKHAIIIEILEKSAVHGGFMLIASAKLPFFLNASMSAPWYTKFINLFVAGGNGAIGNLNKNDLDGQNVYVPLEAEQARIGEFFKQLDNLITLHQRKQNDKFLLFEPKNYANFLANSWEQRKFKESVEIERGGSPRPINDYITNEPNGLNWIKIGDAPEQGNVIVKTAEKIKPSGLSKTRQVQIGDLILSNSMSFGKPYIMGINGCIHDGWLLIRDVQGAFDLIFLCQLLGTDQMLKQYKARAAGSTVNNLNKELVGNTLITVPTKCEQHKLGGLFQKLDDLTARL